MTTRTHTAILAVTLWTGGVVDAWPWEGARTGIYRINCPTSQAHRRIHRTAERDGWRCRYCDRFTLDTSTIEWRLRPAGRHRAAACGAVLVPAHHRAWGLLATLEHVVPLSGGGANSLDNYAVACRRCNQNKAAQTLDEWRPGALR